MDKKELGIKCKTYSELSEVVYNMIGYISCLEKHPSLQKYAEDLEKIMEKMAKEIRQVNERGTN